MPPKRKRTVAAAVNGIVPGEKLRRHPLHNGSGIARWDWVGSEVTQAEDITLDHRMASCNLSPRNGIILCHNKYGSEGDVDKTATFVHEQGCSRANGELEDDIIVISDDDEPVCSKKVCKCNPYCLNYLGQDMWEDEETAMEKYIELANLGENPVPSSREPGVPVGLKNLGATCYANASLQVWFRFAAFRSGVYACEPPETISQEKYKDSPIFQLQVTFAALQDGNQKVFNPARLVESLQLRTSEQQDAQEFSKLFMTHLDAEFKKQTSSSLKSLITNQFQGTQVYGTICHSCKHQSETKSEFLEIEISFKNNAKLEDCISDSLLPEKLSGENQYLCPRCASLQDATRYTELRKLPPVLHFSLMRFVYDLNTMERKKSKHSISFPPNLDMSKFLGSKDDRDPGTSRNCEEDIYELRGVLLHKGASAYHGHYEAQVYDAEHGSWFQCNDEFVTKISGLEEKIPRKRDNDKNSDEDVANIRRKRMYARKRQRIEDSDDDVIEVKPRVSPKRSERSNPITSKDAYMLIYAKKDFQSQLPKPDNRDDSVINSMPRPSSRALQVVQDLNNAHQIACAAYLENENAAKTRFAELRRTVRSIYRDWMTEPSSRSIVVSKQALEAWLSTHCIATSMTQEEGSIVSEPETSMKGQNEIFISSSEITCEHGYLDPKRSNDMKCISLDAYENLTTGTSCTFTPSLSPSDVCSICVSVEFQEILYHKEHPRHVKEVDDIANVGEGEFGYWISKKWYKDWRLLKPRMHVLSEDDPAPDSAEFYNHVYCEHENLTLNLTNRRKISAQAVALLQKLFPKWDPLATNADPCAICETEIHLSKEDKREIRRRIEDEKARLRFILEPSLDAWTKRHDDSYAMLSIQFVKNWKRWLCSPLEHQRPEGIDNTPFFCQHELLEIDPNCSGDLDSNVTVIQRDEWDVLNSIYEGGPLIALSKKITDNGSNYQHDIPVCEDCRTRRKTEWDSADVVIRYIDPNGSKPKPIVTYSSTHGVRQSKRLRQIREDGKRKLITITKSSTVKDIKNMVQEEFSLPAICQRLFYQGKELDDNSATVESLRIFANDVIDLREAEEMVDLTSDGDESPPKKQRKEEGNGFNGTLLGNADAPWSSSPEETPHQTDREKTCPACTFSNASDAVSCQMCYRILV